MTHKALLPHKALLLSASREGNTPYLSHALPFLDQCLSQQHSLLFIPYAGVSISYDHYTNMVQQALDPLNIKVTGIHQYTDPIAAIQQATAIAVGGGNTFALLNQLYQNQLLKPIQNHVANGAWYIGWSAGSNVAGLSIKTTNDMPIVQPPNFAALGLINCQINPHYTDWQPPGHNGETRQMRIEEFMILNPVTPVLGIQEGSALHINHEKIDLWGTKPAFQFIGGTKSIIDPGSRILLNSARPETDKAEH